MRFRQNEILFWWEPISISIFLVLYIALILYYKIFTPEVLIPLIPLLILVILQFNSNKEFVTMDEEGITCQRKSTVLWEYKWSEIQELRKCIVSRTRSILIVPTEDYWKTHSIINAPDPYFQLSAKAKKALKQYCKCPINQIGNRKRENGGGRDVPGGMDNKSSDS